MFKKTLESPLDCKEIKPVNPKENQFWIFIGRTHAEGGAPILGLPDAKSWLIRKDPDAGKDWRQEKGMTRWDSWMVSPTQWTWVWASSRWWWRTGMPGVLQSMGSQRVRHNWATKQQQPQGECRWTLRYLGHDQSLTLPFISLSCSYPLLPYVKFPNSRNRRNFWSSIDCHPLFCRVFLVKVSSVTQLIVYTPEVRRLH